MPARPRVGLFFPRSEETANTYPLLTGVPAYVIEGNYTGPPRFSASQIGTYLECPRKWAWDRIAKVPRATHPSAALGTKTHSHLERYLTTGETPLYTLEDGTHDPSGELAAQALDVLPPPMSPGLEVEASFTFESPRTGFLYRGFIDWRHPSWPDDIPTVGDHKTTSDINRYAKSMQDLATDPQAILYAVETMATYRAPRVRLQWTYIQTRGAKRVLPVVTEFDTAHVSNAFAVLEEVAVEMAEILRTVTKDEIHKVTPVWTHCHAYGGCPYRAHCATAGAGDGRKFSFAA